MYISYYKANLELEKWDNLLKISHLKFLEKNNSWEIIITK